MDQKIWLWRKRSSEKTIVAKVEEVQPITTSEEVDGLMRSCEKMANEAIADKKAKEEVRPPKDELDEVLQQRVAANDRLSHLNSALKDCMDQRNHVCEEQEPSALRNSIRFADSTSESSYLSKALLVKEKMIEDLNNIRSRTEAEFEGLMARLRSSVKETACLRYELGMLQKELELRNEEVEYGRRSTEAAHKQHLEDVKKIKRLDADCQRLCSLMRKKLLCQGDIEVLGTEGPVSRDVYGHDNASKKLESNILSPAPVDRSWTTVKKHPWAEPECKMIGATDMIRMDGFGEIEKLAVINVDVSFSASDVNRTISDSSKEMSLMMKDLVLVENNVDPSSEEPSAWLQNVTNVISEQLKISKRSVDELLGDIRMALQGSARHEPPKSPISSLSSNASLQHSDVNAAMRKIIDLVGQFYSPCSQDREAPDDSFLYEHSSKDSDYRIHVFRWKSCSLTSVLKKFLRSCNNILNGKIDFEKFIGDTASTLEWIVNNCTSFEGHSTVRDEFRKHLVGSGPGTAFELECTRSQSLKGLKNDMNLISDKESDVSLLSGRQDDAALMLKLQQSQEIVTSLQNELELKESRTTEDHIENLRAINEDLDTQLTVTRAKLNEVRQKLSRAEVELDNKNHCCEELEETCVELLLQLESMNNNKYSQDRGGEEGLLQAELAITRASECENTILKPGKQLNALEPSKELFVVNKVMSIISAENKKLKQQRSSLRDQLLLEANEEANRNKQMVCITGANDSSITRASSRNILSFPDGQGADTDKFLRMKRESESSKAGALVVIPGRKRGGEMGLLARLLLRRKKASPKCI